MTVFHWFLLLSVFIFLIAAIRIFISAFRKSLITDPSFAKGKKSSGIIYSFTGAMSPIKKESAFLHLPTYAAGLIYHFGTFLSIFWLIVLFFSIELNEIFVVASAVFIFIASICGIGILLKRIIKRELRQMSNPDDYFSNILVTIFQIITSVTIFYKFPVSFLFVYSAILFLYMPIGKLKHSIYFFIARYQLGIYFGKRGVWPIKKIR